MKMNETNSNTDAVIKMEPRTEGKRKIEAETNDCCIIKRSKAIGYDTPVKETTERMSQKSHAFVFTTRLDEMLIFERNFEELNLLHIWEEILKESKPTYSQHKNSNVTKTVTKEKRLQKLYNYLRIINNRKTLTEVDENRELPNCSKNENLTFINVNNVVNKEIQEITISSNDNDINPMFIGDKTKTEGIKNKANNQITSEHLETTKNISLSPQIINLDKSELLESNEKLEGMENGKLNERQDLKTLSKSLNLSIVYTTRLDDMRILRDMINYFDGKYVLKEILRESQPNLAPLKQKISPMTDRKLKFKQLNSKIQIINNKNRPRCPGVPTPKYFHYKLIPSDVLIQIPNQSAYEKILVTPKLTNYIDDTDSLESEFFIYNPDMKYLEKVEVNKNIFLVIYNKQCGFVEIFVTDANGNITYMHKLKLDKVTDLNKFANNIASDKQKLKLTTCCWFNRDMNVNKVWTHTISRFLKITHPCRPEMCECCCRPRFKCTSNIPQNINTDKDKTVNFTEHGNNSLIARAINYRRPVKNIICNKNVQTRPLLIEVKKNQTTEYYKMNSKGQIECQLVSSPISCQQLQINKTNVTSIEQFIHNKQDYDDFIRKLKESNIPANVINYINSANLPDYIDDVTMNEAKPNLNMLRDIEHTKTCTPVRLIKIQRILNPNTTLKRRPIYRERMVVPTNRMMAEVPENRMNLLPTRGTNYSSNIFTEVIKTEPEYQEGNKSVYECALTPRLHLQQPLFFDRNDTTTTNIKKEDTQDECESNDKMFDNQTLESLVKKENNTTATAEPDNTLNNNILESFIKKETNTTNTAMPLISAIFSLTNNQ